ncbi:MAG: putative secreted protein [Deltaproteobacteria bacterium]|nr:putative secreted protein [Deltaproteobacteria bacterium]
MGVRQRLRYRFDNLMSRGVLAQILLLGAVTAVLVLITALAVVVCDVIPEDDKGSADSFGRVVWKSLMHAFDPGTLSGDTAGWTFLFIMLFVTIGGLFVLSALIGVLNQGFSSMIEGLRRGRSAVVERSHTVILGWTPKIHTLLSELALANSNQRGACVVILASRDKVDMDADVAATVGGARMRVVTRSGSPMKPSDLALVSLASSRAVIVLAPEAHADGSPMLAHESDTVVLKTLLAITKAAPGHSLHLVAELFDPRTEAVARMVAGERAALILATPLISRLLVQTGRQSGLSVVYTELLDFAGAEIYLRDEPALAGTTFRDAVFRYGTSALIGVLTAGGEILLPPPFDRPFAAGDRAIAISTDDDTVILDGGPIAVEEAVLVAPAPSAKRSPERTLVLGAGTRLVTVLDELNTYVAPGSETVVVSEAVPPAGPILDRPFSNMRVTMRAADLTDRRVLESLELTSFDHVLVLSETIGRTQEMADARTTVTLLHLRDLARIAGKKIAITSEILDGENRELATVAEADDFIVSNTLISLMLSQIAENPHLVRVFDQLFAAEGFEIYLKGASDYVRPGNHAFGVVCEAALRRGEIAIGYRLAASANDPAAAYGVAINPAKRSTVRLGAVDKVIVLAEA